MTTVTVECRQYSQRIDRVTGKPVAGTLENFFTVTVEVEGVTETEVRQAAIKQTMADWPGLCLAVATIGATQ